jgi:hypothetical protein
LRYASRVFSWQIIHWLVSLTVPCTQDEGLIPVIVSGNETVLWPRRVALVGYPIFKKFEAWKDVWYLNHNWFTICLCFAVLWYSV